MVPNEKDLLNNLGKIAYTLDKAYLSRLSTDYGVLRFDDKYNQNEVVCYENNIRALQVKRWVFDKAENPGECFKNVLSTFADGDHTIAMLVKRKVDASEIYFVVKNEGQGRNEDSRNNIILLDNSLKGNFPGTYTELVSPSNAKKNFAFEESKSVAVMTNIPSEFSEKFITQGIDKLLNGIVPKNKSEEYSVVFLAESLTQSDIREILSGYEEIATAIVPFLQYQFQVGKGKTDTQGEMKSVSDTQGISESIFKTHSVNIGMNGGVGRGSSHSRSLDIGRLVSSVLGTVGTIAGGAAGIGIAGIPMARVGAVIGNQIGQAVGAAFPSVSEDSSRSMSLGGSAGYGYSWGTSKATSSSQTNTTGTNSSVSLNESENTSYTYKSYMVANMLNKLEKTMKRIGESQGTGLWKYSVYVLAKDAKTSRSVASYLRAITQGNESYMEPAFVQEWSYEDSNGVTPFNEIIKYVSHFTHPVFVGVKDDGDTMLVTPTSYVGTDKLGYVIAFPRKSIQGIPVLEGVQFGREPHSLTHMENSLSIGYGYHMHQKIDSARISLSKEELTKHTFITGSTGSGKSNTIYRLLEQLGKENVHFLVVEPAKGEYKDVFGRKNGVVTYGTNPNIQGIEMLRINPFRFPKNTHILEHLDRLVEIFNVCWPMYAAMPAILKDSVERAYLHSGWDLENSENKYDPNLFPTFGDVVKEIRLVLQESEYSDDNKGDYTGALVTRLKSLTNGINGLIFSADDLYDKELFDQNVIVDLSRVGSSETKSLIMGLLVLKLQEYRMEQRSCGANTNDALKHITVLEEAHNLLRRNSVQGTGEGSNMMGKSVEMLANAIAEMRTYGEGFVIADQSPGLLDMSVIRNTNTKIILRLPDFSDRELVGKAAGLNENQITELSRLEKGVAVISQSDWLEPVLCKIDKYEGDGEPFSKVSGKPVSHNPVDSEVIKQALLDCIMKNEIYRKGDRVDIQQLKEKVLQAKLDTVVKCDFFEYILADEERADEALRTLAFDFLGAEKAIHASEKCTDIKEWVRTVVKHLSPSVDQYTWEQVDLLVALLTYEQAVRNEDYNDVLCRFTELYKAQGGVF